MRTLPLAACASRSLRRLDAGDNPITKVPSAVGRARSLTHLRLAYCNIATLPKELSYCTRLERVDLDGNPLDEPLRTHARRGVDALVTHLAALPSVEGGGFGFGFDDGDDDSGDDGDWFDDEVETAGGRRGLSLWGRGSVGRRGNGASARPSTAPVGHGALGARRHAHGVRSEGGAGEGSRGCGEAGSSVRGGGLGRGGVPPPPCGGRGLTSARPTTSAGVSSLGSNGVARAGGFREDDIDAGASPSNRRLAPKPPPGGQLPPRPPRPMSANSSRSAGSRPTSSASSATDCSHPASASDPLGAASGVRTSAAPGMQPLSHHNPRPRSASLAPPTVSQPVSQGGHPRTRPGSSAGAVEVDAADVAAAAAELSRIGPVLTFPLAAAQSSLSRVAMARASSGRPGSRGGEGVAGEERGRGGGGRHSRGASRAGVSSRCGVGGGGARPGSGWRGGGEERVEPMRIGVLYDADTAPPPDVLTLDGDDEEAGGGRKGSMRHPGDVDVLTLEDEGVWSDGVRPSAAHDDALELSSSDGGGGSFSQDDVESDSEYGGAGSHGTMSDGAAGTAEGGRVCAELLAATNPALLASLRALDLVDAGNTCEVKPDAGERSNWQNLSSLAS